MNDLTILQNALTGKAITRADIIAFEAMIRAHPAHFTAKDPRFTANNFKLLHYFAPGIYVRELHIPADMITTSKIHKTEFLSILAKGKRKTLINGQMQVITAPCILNSPPGFKRASMTLEDSIWITVHANPDNCTDVNELESRLACDSEEEYQMFLEGP